MFEMSSLTSIHRGPVHSPSTDQGHSHGQVQTDSGVYGTKQLNPTVVSACMITSEEEKY